MKDDAADDLIDRLQELADRLDGLQQHDDCGLVMQAVAALRKAGRQAPRGRPTTDTSRLARETVEVMVEVMMSFDGDERRAKARRQIARIAMLEIIKGKLDGKQKRSFTILTNRYLREMASRTARKPK